PRPTRARASPQARTCRGRRAARCRWPTSTSSRSRNCSDLSRGDDPVQSRIIWPVAGIIALVVVVLAVSLSGAQRPERPVLPGMGGMLPMQGRFVVAHASATQVLILDTTTGKVYKAGEKDFKPMSELP